MENKTEIGKLFKHKLTNLEKSPSDNLWASIERDLNEKRKKRILGWLIPSIATIAVISSVLFFTQSDQQDKDKISDKNQTTPHLTKRTANSKNKDSQNTITISTSSKPKKLSTKADDHFSETKAAPQKNKTGKLINESRRLIASTSEYDEYEIVKKYTVIIKKEKTITKSVKKSKSEAIKKTVKNPFYKSKKNKAINVKNKPVNSSKKTPVLPIKTVTDSINRNLVSKKTEKDTILTTEEIKINKDSTTTVLKKKTAPKREYVERTYPKTEKDLDLKYSVSAFYGPAYFGSFSNQSFINPTFDNLSKSHPITSHYGFYLKTMYQRIGLRAGISKINLKITTQLNETNLITNYSNINLSGDYTSTKINETYKDSEKVTLEQKLSYYEIPLEFNYAIKADEDPIGVDVFTGFSFMILDDNNLSLSSDKIASRKIGEAKNVSGVNTSFNLGLGLNYKLTEKFQLDFKPIFKYYLKTFDDGNASKPYSLSIQSGVTYKF
jgi:hypothetical protein